MKPMKLTGESTAITIDVSRIEAVVSSGRTVIITMHSGAERRWECPSAEEATRMHTLIHEEMRK